MSSIICDAHRHLGALPAWPFYGGPPVQHATRQQATVRALLRDLPALVAGASAFLFPSTKEGFGLAAMEALATGVPVVMRDLPVLREIFEGAVRFASSPATLAAAVAAALDEPSAPLTDAGRALARRHTWAAAATAHRRLYQRVLAGATIGS